MPGHEVITEKLLRLLQYLQQLEEIQPDTYDRYASDLTRRLAAERLIQLIVDIALDINNLMLSAYRRAPASDYFNSFIDLAEAGVLDAAFALSIAPSTSIRNRLVHEYEKTDDRIVFASIPKFLGLYRKYADFINKANS